MLDRDFLFFILSAPVVVNGQYFNAPKINYPHALWNIKLIEFVVFVWARSLKSRTGKQKPGKKINQRRAFCKLKVNMVGGARGRNNNNNDDDEGKKKFAGEREQKKRTLA